MKKLLTLLLIISLVEFATFPIPVFTVRLVVTTLSHPFAEKK